MRRFALVIAVTMTAVLAGCAPGAAPHRWHDGQLFVATGNTSGVFYQFGGGYADLISQYLPGYEARAEPTGASGDNVARIVAGDMDVALCNGDTAADAASGHGAYQGKPLPVRALARLYRNTMQVVVRADENIQTLTDLRGKKVSTSTLNSGTDVLAGRMLEVAGLNPDSDIRRLRLSLSETVNGMRSGTVDALFFTGGLPTPGITDLIDSAPGKFVVLPTAGLLSALQAKFGKAYTAAPIGKAVYHSPADVDTIVVPTMLLVAAAMPDDIAFQLTRLLFVHQSELAKVHPEGANFDLANGPKTDPVPLHPGAARYYRGD